MTMLKLKPWLHIHEEIRLTTATIAWIAFLTTETTTHGTNGNYNGKEKTLKISFYHENEISCCTLVRKSSEKYFG